VFSRTWLVVGLLAGSALLRGSDSLGHAQLAREWLGRETWAQVIEIENTARHSRYPRVVDAVVFEFGGLLWFYTDTDGTQSFSLHVGRLAEEKGDFGPLLRDIEPGFVRWRVVDGAARGKPGGVLPNGCFIASIAAWRERTRRGVAMENPRLLSFYVAVTGGLKGHTVLVYSADGELHVIDTIEREVRASTWPESLAADPLLLAQRIEGERVARAREVPLGVNDRGAVRVADTAAPGDRGGQPRQS
jgi:hypothetical protein